MAIKWLWVISHAPRLRGRRAVLGEPGKRSAPGEGPSLMGIAELADRRGHTGSSAKSGAAEWEVFSEAVHARLGHRVALKRLHPHVAARPGATERFLREGRAVARIRHPNVVQVFALEEGTSGPYLAMELLDGHESATMLTRAGRIQVQDALELLLPVIAGVAAAHDAGVIHRDLKPSNIFIAQGAGGRRWPKVLDFGVSKVLELGGAVEPAATDAIVGTAAYMAPEQTRSARHASFKSDQYALAVILYQCLTGKAPFSGATDYEVAVAVMTAPICPPSVQVPSLPPALDEVILRAMSRHPDDRFATVRAFGMALLPFAREGERHAWTGELGGDGAPPVDLGEDPASDSIEPAAGITMRATARDTRVPKRANRSPIRARLAALAVGAFLVAVITTLDRTDRRSRADVSPVSVRAVDSERVRQAATAVEMVVIPQALETEVAHVDKPRSPEVVVNDRPHVSAHGVRSSVAPSPSGISSSGATRPASPRPVLGENGAPILP